VSASDDCTLRIWDITKMECEQVFKNHMKGVVVILDLSPKCLFLTGGKDKCIKIYSYMNKDAIKCIKSIYNAHDSILLSLAFNYEYDLLISSGFDKYIKCFNIYSGTLKSAYKNDCSIYCLEFISKKALAAGCHIPGITIFSMNFKIIKVLKGHTQSVFCLLYLKKIKALVSGSLDNSIILWDVKNGTPLRVLKSHFRSVLKLINFPDKDMIGSFGYDNAIRLWNYKKGKNVKTILQTDFQRGGTHSLVYHYYASFVYVEEEKKFFFSYFGDNIKVREAKVIKDEARPFDWKV